MKNNKNGKVYYSFDELGQEVFGLKPLKQVTNDKQKLESQREKFLGTCPFCKEPLTYIFETNILACQNENCKGKKITIKNKDGEEQDIYKPYYKMLSNKGSKIGTILFDEVKGNGKK